MPTFKINESLPSKYSLECHSSMPNYPTKQDFMFDMVSHLVRTLGKAKTFKTSDAKFSAKSLREVFGEKLSGEFLAKVKLIIEELVKDGALIKKDEFIVVPESEFLNYYSLI